ncbi:NAD(P)H-quinone oxidoreductase [Pelagibacteraceae bacterium]|nr:NAD(P)H-quinone oxidoreductase [Pelagibacteraceae bacterium]
MKAILHRKFGGPEVLEVSNNVEMPKIEKDEVLIKVHAAGINRPDILQRSGGYPPPPGASKILGLEVSGEIVDVGEDINKNLLNTKVCALVPGGGYAEFVKCHTSTILPIPKGISIADACTIPETFFTVWTNLFDQANLKRSETLLVHGGASGIGLTAISIAIAMQIKCIATVGSDEKYKYLQGLGLERVINYNIEDFEIIIKNEFKGVDVILDMVGGDYFQKNINILTRLGRLLNIAYLKGSKVEVNLLPIMLKRLTISGSTLRIRSNDEKKIIADNLKKYVWPLIESKNIKLHIDQRFDFSNVQKAHQYMENNKNIGKLLLKF